jgi:hypothetical protein
MFHNKTRIFALLFSVLKYQRTLCLRCGGPTVIGAGGIAGPGAFRFFFSSKNFLFFSRNKQDSFYYTALQPVTTKNPVAFSGGVRRCPVDRQRVPV